MGFIETHSHLLPFVDDGVGSKEDFSRMMQAYKEAGFDRIVVTPHLYNPYVSTRTRHIRPMFAWARDEAKSYHIELMLGSETYIGDAADPQFLPFLDTFVLVEVDMVTEPLFLLNYVYKLVKRGFSVILAHIERYQWFNEQSTVAQKLRQMGVYFQCNADQVEKGKADRWLRSNMVDVFASDNHGDAELPARLAALFRTYPEVLNKMESLFQDSGKR